MKTRVARTRPSMNEGCHRYLKRRLPFLVVGVLTLFLLTAVFSQVTFSNVEAELTITKSSLSDPVIAGKSLTYTIDVRNPGPSDALNVIITETYDTNFIFSSSSPSPDRRTTNQWTFKAIRAGDWGPPHTDSPSLDPENRLKSISTVQTLQYILASYGRIL